MAKQMRERHETGEAKERETAKSLCANTGEKIDTLRARWNSLSRMRPDLFAHPFDRNAPLSPEQIELLTKTAKEGKAQTPVLVIEGLPKVAAPTIIPEVKPRKNYGQIIALAVAFVLPTVASMSNTYKVSHYLSNDATTSLCIMLVLSATPVLFMMGNVSRAVYWAVGGGVILVECFFNLSATYIALMGGMTYIFGQPTGVCSPFLDTVCRVTNGGYQQTALWLGLVVAVSIAATQLAAFYELKKRI